MKYFKTTPSGEQQNILPPSCKLGLDSAIISKAVAQVRSSPEIASDLTRHLIDLDLKLDLFEVYEGRARALRQTMELQAGGRAKPAKPLTLNKI